jgi:uncharacterized glyoxalase superfamily protein PhnB
MTTTKPDHAPWATPYITVQNVKAAQQFYETAFGFKTHEAVPGENDDLMHLEMTYHEQLLMFGPQNVCGNTSLAPASSNVVSPISMYLYCDNVDTFYQHAVAAGAKSIAAPEDVFWGDRMCKLEDPNGYHWCFATKINS